MTDTRFDPSSADYQFVERRQWMPAFGISYHVGLDGISLMLVVLTAFLSPIALLSSWESVHKKVMAFTLFTGFGLGSLLFQIAMVRGFGAALIGFGCVGLLASSVAVPFFRTERPHSIVPA